VLENPHLEVPLLVLVRSEPQPLKRLRRSEWLPHGGRFATAGVAVDRDELFYGWAVYTAEPIVIPSGVEHRGYVRFELLVPAASEFDVLYRGRDIRRAYGAANAVLRREGARVELDWVLLERTWRNVDTARAAERYHERRRAFAARRRSI
jgi:hypothetical protein